MKLLAVCKQEYLATVRTRAFLLALILMPLLMGASIAIPLLGQNAATVAARRCVIVDRSRQLFDALQRAAATRNRELPQGEHYLFESNAPAERQAQGLALSREVRSERLFCFVEIEANVLEPAADDSMVQARYYSSTPTHLALPHWLQQALSREVRSLRLSAHGVDLQLLERAEVAVSFPSTTLYQAGHGRRTPPESRNPIEDILLPLLAAIVMFMSVLMGATPLMQSVLEEKMYRIAEVLVSSVPPTELMMGKLLGAIFVSFTLLALYAGGTGLSLMATGIPNPLSLIDVLWLLAFQTSALLMYGSVFLAVGSACNDLRETQTLIMPVLMLVMTPLLLLSVVISDPNGTLSTVASLIPFFSPILMMVRVMLEPGAPLWQALLALTGSAAMAFLCVVAAGRIFRVGMLSGGAAPTPRELARWVRRP